MIDEMGISNFQGGWDNRDTLFPGRSLREWSDRNPQELESFTKIVPDGIRRSLGDVLCEDIDDWVGEALCV